MKIGPVQYHSFHSPSAGGYVLVGMVPVTHNGEERFCWYSYTVPLHLRHYHYFETAGYAKEIVKRRVRRMAIEDTLCPRDPRDWSEP